MRAEVAEDRALADQAFILAIEPVGDRVRVQTALQYPEGSYVDVFLDVAAGAVARLTDLGQSCAWLRDVEVAVDEDPVAGAWVADVCKQLQVEIDRGELATRVHAGESLAQALLRLAQACVRTTDLLLLVRLD